MNPTTPTTAQRKGPPGALPPLTRFVSAGVGAASLDKASRTLTLSFSSEYPVERWYGTEVLSHAPGAADLSRLNDGAPLLFNHNMDDVLGVVQTARIDSAARKGIATVRFANTPRADEVMQMVEDDILRNVSFMYRVPEYTVAGDAEYIATEWTPLEISIVTVPADPNVGIGRAAHTSEQPVRIVRAADTADAAFAKGDKVEALVNHMEGMKGMQGEIAQVRNGPYYAINFDDPMEGMKNPHKWMAESELKSITAGKAEDGMAMKSVDSVLSRSAAPAARSTTTGVIPMDTDNTQTAGPSNTANTSNVTELQQARVSAQGEERARIAEIESMCGAHNLGAEFRSKLVREGVSIAEARGLVLEELGKRGKQTALTNTGHAPDLTEKEKGQYSLIRAINASLSGNWKEAGFELEISNEIAKRMGKGTTGFYMPTNLPVRAANYATGAAATGGDLVATNLLAGSFIEVLRNKARVMQLGATVLSGLVGNVDIPRRTSATTTYWVGEQTNVTPSGGAFDKVSLGLKTIGALSVITRNMLMQGTPDIEMLVRADMIAQLALGIDLAALSGSGTAAQPLGIANTAGIGTVIGGTDGGALTIDNLIDLETSVTENNAPEDRLAYLANARSVGALKKLKSTTGEYLWITAADMGRTGTPGEINGYPVARSNQARGNLTKGTGTNLSELFFGSWGELLIGEWGVLEVQPNPYAASVSAQGGVELRALQSIDIAVRHAQSFAVMSDAITG